MKKTKKSHLLNNTENMNKKNKNIEKKKEDKKRIKSNRISKLKKITHERP